jgi:integrase/recombinase XerD
MQHANSANSKIIIYQALANSQRIKVFIPFLMTKEREAFKKLNTTFYHSNQKLWSILNTQENLLALKQLFIDKYEVIIAHEKPAIPQKSLNATCTEALVMTEQKLVLKGFSRSSIKSYLSELKMFFSFYESQDIEQITKAEIEGYVYQLVSKYKISESKQNSCINAIKAYYEHVLGKPREYYDIQRPKKADQLPTVFTKEEVSRILQSPTNTKHRAILFTIYSAGLRISEALNLRLVDINSDEGYIFIKSAKGKKDRKSVLSPILLGLLRSYYKEYKPSYWLFEGQDGGQYSAKSIQKILRKAVKDTNSNPWGTVHTLRHSFATHLLQEGMNLRYIQTLLGHSSSKTTEIYTRVVAINNKNIKSPLDFLEGIATFAYQYNSPQNENKRH